MMKSLSRDDQHLSVAAQTLQSADFIVRELVENSVDAHATNIDIKFKNYGLEGISVTDNGQGIDEESLKTVAKHGHTSKLEDDSELELIKTSGFRGKALHSIALLCNTRMVSKHDSCLTAFEVVLSSRDENKLKKCYRTQGTTVEVTEIFNELPVRKKDFQLRYKAYYAKSILYLYSTLLLRREIKFNISNVEKDGTKKLVFSNVQKASLKDTILKMFCIKNAKILKEVSKETCQDQFSCKVHGYADMSGTSFQYSTRHFLYLNGRIWSCLTLSKRINKLLSQLAAKSGSIFCVLFIETDQSVDLNVSSDKEQKYVANEGQIFDFVTSAITEACQNENSNDHVKTMTLNQSLMDSFTHEPADLSTSNLDIDASEMSLNSSLDSQNISQQQSPAQHAKKHPSLPLSKFSSPQSTNSPSIRNEPRPLPALPVNYMKHFKSSQKVPSSSPSSKSMPPNTISKETNFIEDVPCVLSTNIDEIVSKAKLKEDYQPSRTSCLIMTKDSSSLQQKIKKDIFSKLSVIGQFNNGFIVASNGADFYMIDQHGADERYNFDSYISNPQFESQKLVAPMPLKINMMQKVILSEKQDFFRKCGYEFVVNDSTGDFMISHTPMIKNLTFKPDYLIESIDKLSTPGSESEKGVVLPQDIIEIMASKSCRKSIMIGTPLNKSVMSVLLQNLTKVEYPWACAHGRPIVQHLFRLESNA